MQNKNIVRTAKDEPDKSIIYLPPELGKSVRVSFFLDEPKKINSQILGSKQQVLLIVDDNLDQGKISTVLLLLKKQVKQISIYKLNYGQKNLSRVSKIWDEMIRVHPDVAISLGGGTTCDLVGFAASCYHRGLDHIFFPTTLLSMVDACIGGKTGIDFGGVKNSIGQVHYARESFCLFPFLKTLEYSELISGFSEVIKAGMLFDERLIRSIEKLPEKFSLTDDWLVVINRGAELKAKMSEKTLHQRSKLLYGHNIGHGFETLNSLHRRHGDCVAIGMNYESALGVVMGLVDRSVWQRQYNLLQKFNLPSHIPERADFEQIKKNMRKYKLYKDSKYLFVIPRKPGEIIESNLGYYCELSEEDLNSAYGEAKKIIFQ